MARRVYFAFHYKDVWRVNVVRNSWRMKPNRESAGYFDASLWEETKKQGDRAIKRMINKGLKNTSVTAVLLGSKTANRKWVRYELVESVKRGNGILAIRIHRIGKSGNTRNPLLRYAAPAERGPNILDRYTVDCRSEYGIYSTGPRKKLGSIFETYGWVTDRGYSNFGQWVEKAATLANRHLPTTPAVRDLNGRAPIL